MAVPTYDQFIEPVLRYLAVHPDGAIARDVHDATADVLNVSETDRAEMLPSGTQLVYKNRAGWAHDRLKRAGLSTSRRRGFWQLTEAGAALAAKYPSGLPDHVIESLLREYNDVRLRLPDDEGVAAPSGASELSATVSPDDRLEQAVSELRLGVVAEVLDQLSRVSPTYFETVVLDVLHKLGYGTSRADLTRVGRSGDGGIDGVISLDRLGLEKVYVQAKRWQSSVGRPEVQGFYGALAGQRANRGVFITTSSFSTQAVEFAGSVERVVLVDGRKLAELMIEFEVGVTSRSVRIPKVDSDYFEE
ncbi:MAG: restriction endonuclease [Vicinamibacterales bacterium]